MKSNFYSKKFRLNHLYKIVDKNGKTITFKLNKSQEEFHEFQKINNRIILLKARQLGMTTYKVINGLDDTIFKSNQTTIITAHKIEKLKEIFEKVKFAYENLPNEIKLNDGKTWSKPIAHYNNVNELFFKDLNSKIKVTLDSRSGTPTSLHITELAFMQKAKEMWTGSMPSIPVNAPVTVETTANGIGNFFNKLWLKYYGREDGEFKCLFFPWYNDLNYSLEGDYEIVDELKHLLKLNLTKEQINRYINQYDILGREVFQEYPSTPQEAFLTTGDNVFNLLRIRDLIINEYKEDEKFKHLRIYKPPTNQCLYGVDTAGGSIDGDKSSIVVRDSKTMELLACFYGFMQPDLLCDIIDRLQELGYFGIIGIERNNTGIATLKKAETCSWYYQLFAEKTIDKITNKKTKKYGWSTNSKTRPFMISEYEEAIRCGYIKEIDKRGQDEMFTFVYNDNSRPEAQLGSHDDYIISDCICYQMRNETNYIEFI